MSNQNKSNTSRRKFIRSTALASVALTLPNILSSKTFPAKKRKADGAPIVISTWRLGLAANYVALEILKNGGYALDAVEAGTKVPEGDPKVQSVGYGGFPDRDGKVTLDASIMNEKNEAGAVAFVQGIMHPISLARMVMEKTPHVLIVGAGAEQFALENGFKMENLLTPEAEKAWKEWMAKNNYKPADSKGDEKGHDTIGMIAMDTNGRICGACTTSGLAWKIHGRVGDSPIIGAGLFVDGEVGGAAATGVGELVLRTSGSHLVVEMMRMGHNPQEACRLAVERIINKIPDLGDKQVGFIAMNTAGETGAYSVQKGFQFALGNSEGNVLTDAQSKM